ncbi:MAG: helix-turn-helix domain-containing protein [Thermonemataceae bacterium]
MQSVSLAEEVVVSSNRCYSLFFKPYFLDHFTSGSTLIEKFPFFDPTIAPVLYLSDQQLATIQELFLKMHQVYNQYYTDSEEMIKHYLYILLLLIKRSFQPAQITAGYSQRRYEIYYQFEALLQRQVNKLNTVADFADHLALSTKHLSETVKEVSGKTALQLINEKKLQEAKSLLYQTEWNITEIAQALNFENANYFTTFFKRMTGCTPTQFRHI